MGEDKEITGVAIQESRKDREPVTTTLKKLVRIVTTKSETISPEDIPDIVDTEEFLKNAEEIQNIAHKAGAGKMPEGTLPAMKDSLKDGADWIDIDVRMSKDGELVISHSPRAEDIDEGRGVKGEISELSLSEIKKLDAGYNFTTDEKDFPYRGKGITIPTLKEAFEAFPEAKFAIHLLGQNEGIEGKLVGAIEESDVSDMVLVAGFSDEQLNKVKELSGGEIKITAGAKATIDFMYAVKSGEIPKEVPFDVFAPGGEETLSGNFYERHGSNLLVWLRHSKLPDKDYIEACKKLEIPMFVWTVNDEDEMMQWIALGVGGMYTDYPSRLNELKKQFSKEAVATMTKPEYEEMAENLAYTLVDGMTDWVIAFAAAERLGWEDRIPTAEELIAEAKRMQGIVMKGGEGANQIKQRLEQVIDKYMRKDAPELYPYLEGLEEVVSIAADRLTF